jgi:hypothetical protein
MKFMEILRKKVALTFYMSFSLSFLIGCAPFIKDATSTSTTTQTNQTPVLITNGLVLHLDASKAKSGNSAPYSNGCSLSDLTWYDSSASAFLGTLNNYNSCGASTGWVGNGTPSSPYALAMDGVNDSVTILHHASLNTFPITIAAWVNFSGIINQQGAIVNKYLPASSNGYNFYVFNGNICAWYNLPSAAAVYEYISGDECPMSVSGFNDGKWHYVALVINSSGGKIYVDSIQRSSLAWTGTPGSVSTAQNLILGLYPASGNNPFTGKIAAVHIYNIDLTQAQLKQNCQALESRFTAISSSICGL